MSRRFKKRKRGSLVALMLLFFLTSSTVYGVKNVAASTGSGTVLDLFTQKVPFGGKGPNIPSDAFQPQELVILYANVTYNGAAVVGKLVSFQVEGPANALSNITVSGTGITNSSGLATFSFRIPWPSEHPEEIVFGIWSAVATVDVAQVAVEDTLTFRVGWILQITSIATLNSELMPQTTFFLQDIVNFNLTVENIAMVEKTGTITLEVEDAAGHPIINIMIENLTFQPGENNVNGSSRIPSTATIGNATVWAAIYTAPPAEGGVLYSPAISSEIEIAEKSLSHDIGFVSMTVSPNSVYVGGIVEIYVTIKNNGTATENNCDLVLYYGSSSTWTRVENIPVTLALGSKVRLPFSWNTSSVSVGLYLIKAHASLPDDETDPSPGDNTLINGSVLVKTMLPGVDDIGITSVALSTNSTFAGGVVKVYVTVRNNGTATESFSLSAYYNSSLFETIQIDALKPNENVTRAFAWSTSGVSPGVYQISASAPLTGDPSPGDNTFLDGFVQVKPVLLSSLLLSEVFIAFISGLAIIASLILFLMLGFGRRRRKKKPSRYAVVVHLHI